VRAANLVKWLAPCAAATVFAVMVSLGPLFEPEQIISAPRRR
jgi:hypothetical protein